MKVKVENKDYPLVKDISTGFTHALIDENLGICLSNISTIDVRNGKRWCGLMDLVVIENFEYLSDDENYTPFDDKDWETFTAQPIHFNTTPNEHIFIQRWSNTGVHVPHHGWTSYDRLSRCFFFKDGKRVAKPKNINITNRGGV